MYEKINHFIKLNIEILDDPFDNIKQLEKIGNFIENENIFLTSNDYLYLINNNNKIILLLKQLIIENINVLNQFGINFISENKIVQNFINYYSIENNIKFIKKDKIFNGDLYLNAMLDEYLKQLPDERLTKCEEKILILKIREGNIEAYNYFIVTNLKLVVNIAKIYNKYNNVPILDLIQEGNVGLIEAIDKYDIERNLKFSSYATPWIKGYILNDIKKLSKCVSVGAKGYSKLIKSAKIMKDFLEKYKRKITIEELSEILELDIFETAQIINLLDDYISLDEPINPNGELLDTPNILKDLIEDERISTEDKIIKQQMIDDLNNILINFDKRNVEIFKWRRGLYDGIQHTQKELAKKYNLSVQRIGQIEEIILKKLLNSESMINLSCYMNDPASAKSYYLNNKNNNEFRNKLKLKNKKETNHLE